MDKKIPVNKILLISLIISLTTFVFYLIHPFVGLVWNLAGLGILTTWMVGQWETQIRKQKERINE